MDNYELIAIFYLYDKKYVYSLYKYDLQQVVLYPKTIDSLGSSYDKDGIFFKAIYLYEQYIAFLYFDLNNYIKLRILSFDGNYFQTKKYYELNVDYLMPTITLNEFLKIDNQRLVLVSIVLESSYSYSSLYSNPNKQLYIIFIDLYNNFEYIKYRYYHYFLEDYRIYKFSKEISAFIFNGFLAFTGTVLPSNYNANENNFFSIFLMFSYPNGTDSEINIFPYLMDTGSYDSSYNLFYYLMEFMKIDNNILGYEPVREIRLVSIPDEIIFLNENDNSFISNNSNIDYSYILNQNKNKIKENKYYNLDYQYIVKEPEYERFYSNSYCETRGDSQDVSQYFIPKILYGRTNTLKFKLCHPYCQTCFQMSINDNEQKCESCLEEYSYNNNENTKSECVAEGYFLMQKIK